MKSKSKGMYSAEKNALNITAALLCMLHFTSEYVQGCYI